MESQTNQTIEEINEDNIETNNDTNINPTQTLTKRQLKRRADKLKRQSELRQLEKIDAIHRPNPHIEKKKAKKQEIRKALDGRRKLILDRLEWAKANLPMLSPDSEVSVITMGESKTDVSQ